MKIIVLLISIVLLSLLFVWWINFSINSTKKSVNTIKPIYEGQDIQTQTGPDPIDYSNKIIEEIKEMSEDRSKEINQLP